MLIQYQRCAIPTNASSCKTSAMYKRYSQVKYLESYLKVNACMKRSATGSDIRIQPKLSIPNTYTSTIMDTSYCFETLVETICIQPYS